MLAFLEASTQARLKSQKTYFSRELRECYIRAAGAMDD